MISNHRIRIRAIALAASIVSILAGVAQPSEEPSAPMASAATDITVSFKLDPRLTGGTYGGERWVSPATYTGAGGQDSVDVKASAIGKRGEPVRIDLRWVVSDPEMITVSPSEGEQVKISVKRAGESKVQVTASGISKPLAIKAEQRGSVLQIRITQLPAVSDSSSPKADTAVERPQESSNFEDPKERLSYAVGMNLASALRKQSVEVDLDVLVQGLKDAYAGTQTLLTEQEVRATLLEEQHELKTKQAEMGKQRAEESKKNGEEFLAANASKPGIVTLPSGLQYKILKAGEGKRPTLDDTVVCQYRGILLDGTEFDSSYKRGEPASLPLRRVIRGWREALQLMPVGSKWQLFLPAELAYGKPGKRGAVGPNAALIFEVELLSIRGGSDNETRTADAENVSAPGAAVTEQSPETSPDAGAIGETPVPSPAALATNGLKDMKISFKLDPRLSGSTYGGERWVNPPRFTAVEDTVEAKAVAVDPAGNSTEVKSTWTPADPDMVTVSPEAGSAVKISVKRVGESKLTVASNGISKELSIKAKYAAANRMQVEITQ